MEAVYYKFDSDCLSGLMFVEDLFSLITLQTYPCNNDNILETWKRQWTTTAFVE